ncbi:hypothetical protein C0995_008762 [Termitomyces sp. Mi166|nr:hypothetical protein C0995_008762 [Termitomyces sp. Mi166\
MATDLSCHPTIFLPSLARLSTQSTQQIREALKKLCTLYWPPPLPAQMSIPKRTILTKIHDVSVPDSGYASAENSDDEGEESNTITHVISGSQCLEVLRADTLEREFAVRWATGFISRSDSWIDDVPDDNDKVARAQLLDEATKLLSAFIGDEMTENDKGDEGEPAMVRSISFPKSEEGEAIEVQLHDAPMLEDDHTSVGLQSWGSCIRFGKRICANPSYFSLPPPIYCVSDRPLRVLELGAGTGLLSILAAKLLHNAPHPPTIIATDFHPDVLANLAINVSANLSSPLSPSSSPSPLYPYPQVQVHTLDWEHPITPPPLDEPFDVILAADVIYHPHHAHWIRGCVERLLRRPSSSGSGDSRGGVFWMFNAVREVGRHEGLAESVEQAFDGSAPVWEEVEKVKMATGKMGLRILDMEEADKEVGVGRVDESGYKLFRIGWMKAGCV